MPLEVTIIVARTCLYRREYDPKLVQPSFFLTLPDNSARTWSMLFSEIDRKVPCLAAFCTLRLWEEGVGWLYFEATRSPKPLSKRRVFVRVVPLFTYYEAEDAWITWRKKMNLSSDAITNHKAVDKLVSQGPFVALLYHAVQGESLDFRHAASLMCIKSWVGGYTGIHKALAGLHSVPHKCRFRLFYPEVNGSRFLELKRGSKEEPNIVFVRAEMKSAEVPAHWKASEMARDFASNSAQRGKENIAQPIQALRIEDEQATLEKPLLKSSRQEDRLSSSQRKARAGRSEAASADDR